MELDHFQLQSEEHSDFTETKALKFSEDVNGESIDKKLNFFKLKLVNKILYLLWPLTVKHACVPPDNNRFRI